MFLGVGAPQGVKLGMPGEDAEGIADALAFLRTYNLRGSVPVGKEVVVIGGGNSAIDAARTAVRLGAENVTVVYRRSREAMPAYEEEIEEAEHEGVVLRLLTAPVRDCRRGAPRGGREVRADAAGRFDRSGRRRPEEGGDAFVIPADQVLVAIGQTLGSQAPPRRTRPGDPQRRLPAGQPGHRADLGEMDLRRRRRRQRALLGGRGRGRRRARGRGHRPLPHRREPRLLARGPRRSIPPSIPRPIPPTPRARSST